MDGKAETGLLFGQGEFTKAAAENCTWGNVLSIPSACMVSHTLSLFLFSRLRIVQLAIKVGEIRVCDRIVR